MGKPTVWVEVLGGKDDLVGEDGVAGILASTMVRRRRPIFQKSGQPHTPS